MHICKYVYFNGKTYMGMNVYNYNQVTSPMYQFKKKKII